MTTDNDYPDDTNQAELFDRVGEDRPMSHAVNGAPFDPEADVWRFRTNSRRIKIDLGALALITTPEMLAGIRASLRLVVETRNLNSVTAADKQLRNLLRLAHERRQCPVETILAEDVAAWVANGYGAYRDQLRIVTETRRTGGETWFTPEAHEYLGRVQVKSKSPYEAVMTLDPEKGPYRPVEDAALKTALDQGFNNGSIDLYDYALIRLIRGLGIRMVQVAAMKIGDLRRDGSRSEIHIPLAKQRGAPDRSEFMPWKPLSQGLADILFLHVETNVLTRLAKGADPTLAPLFPALGGPVEGTLGFDSHLTADDLAKIFRNAFVVASVISPITGATITANPRRERHTVLTGLAMLGCTAEEIAANAGHKNPSSCEVYVDAGIEHHQRMESLVGPVFVPIADRFLGNVVRSEQDAKAAKDPNSILVDRGMNGVGSCADGGCSAIDAGAAPLACYTCRRFRAWSDGPHETLLEILVADRTRLVEAGHAEVAETRTAAIVAIADLLERIRKQKDTDLG